MRRLPSRYDVTMPSVPSAATSARPSVDLTQMSAPRSFRIARRDDLRAELVDAAMQPRVQRAHVLARLCDPDLLHQLDPGDARVDRRHRRRARLEARARSCAGE